MNPFDIAKKFDCTVFGAIRRMYFVKKEGESLESACDNDLFYMTSRQLRRYFANKQLRSYSQLIVEREGTTEYEAYRQMRRARTEFDIPYSVFNRNNLFNASDEKMASIRKNRSRKKNKFIGKIAKSADISIDDAKEFVSEMYEQYKVTAEFCYTNQLYGKTDEQIREIVSSGKKRIAAKKVMALEETGWSEEKLSEHIAKCSSRFRIGNDYYYSLKCYNLTDEQLEGVLVHSDIHKLSAMLNVKPKRVDDKDQFMRNYKEFLGRKSWSNSNTTFQEFEEFARGLDEIFVKPVDGMHGKGVRKIPLEGKDLNELYKELMSERALVAEEVILQHPDMAAFNPTSINTVRIYTIQDGDDVDIVNAYVRFGNGGIIDNYSSGGLECGVDPKTGIINTPAVCKSGEVFTEHPLTHIAFEGFQIPLWGKVIERASNAIKAIDDINFVGWDVAIGPNDTLLVEGNADPGPGAFQRFLLEQDISMRERFAKYLKRL